MKLLPENKRVRPWRVLPLLVVLASACGEAADPASTPTPKAVFVIVDGIPADVIESVATPALDAIAAIGGYARSWVGGEVGAASDSPTVSAVGYQSLITGTWANKHNVYDNDVSAPDYRYWDIFRIAREHDPALKTAIFSSWLDNRTKLVGDGLPEAGGNKIDYSFDGLELDTARFPHDGADPDLDEYIGDIDAAVATEAARYLEAVGPDLAWVYLQYTDDIAHRFGDGPEFNAAVKVMDAYVGAIWQAIEARTGSHDEDWLIVVTTDHGRDAVDGREHGEQTERERTTWIVTNSDRLNARFTGTPPIVDILPSIAAHLRLDMPAEIRTNLDGQSFIDPP